MLKWLFPSRESDSSSSKPSTIAPIVGSPPAPSRKSGVPLCSGSTFKKDVLEKSFSKPVVVWFSAKWCGPCKMIAPGLAEIADELSDRMAICQVDVDSEPELAQTFGVRSVPTLALFSQGEVVDVKVGAAPKTAMSSLLSSWIDKARSYVATTVYRPSVHPFLDKYAVAVRKFGTLSGDPPDDDHDELFYRISAVTSFQFAIFSALSVEHIAEMGSEFMLFTDFSMSEVLEATLSKWEVGEVNHSIIFYVSEDWWGDAWRNHPEFQHIKGTYLTDGLDIELKFHDEEVVKNAGKKKLAIIVPRYPAAYQFPKQ
jgi:thioredoxin 1